jgi:TRAP-type mannitol/chloroaromatic compound transport system permease small subunit
LGQPLCLKGGVFLHTIKKTIKTINSITNWVGKISSWSVIIMMLLVVFEVISRRLFNAPTMWNMEITTMIFGFHFMMVAAYALLHQSLVSVDILYEKFSIKKQAILDLITYSVLFLPFVIGTLIGSSRFAYVSWMQQEVSWTAFAPPVYPIKTIIPIAIFFLLLQGISEMLKRIVTLVEGEKYL